MTLARDRERIMAALASVGGLSPYPCAPDVITEGAAWPNWVQSSFAGGKLVQPLLSTFEVLSILPAGTSATTVAAADSQVETLMYALRAIAGIDLGDGVRVTFPAGDNPALPAIRVRCTPQPERSSHAPRSA